MFRVENQSQKKKTCHGFLGSLNVVSLLKVTPDLGKVLNNSSSFQG